MPIFQKKKLGLGEVTGLVCSDAVVTTMVARTASCDVAFPRSRGVFVLGASLYDAVIRAFDPHHDVRGRCPCTRLTYENTEAQK